MLRRIWEEILGGHVPTKTNRVPSLITAPWRRSIHQNQWKEDFPPDERVPERPETSDERSGSSARSYRGRKRGPKPGGGKSDGKKREASSDGSNKISNLFNIEKVNKDDKSDKGGGGSAANQRRRALMLSRSIL